jgi:hypothetical protein
MEIYCIFTVRPSHHMYAVTFERIRTLLLSGSSDINEGELKLALIGICRDLRGVVSVCSSRPTYLILFEWMYPIIVVKSKTLRSVCDPTPCSP